jgi:CheY-like chemotaxis protein
MPHAMPPLETRGAQKGRPFDGSLHRTAASAQPMRSVLCIGQDASGALVTQRMVESAEGLVAAQNAADALLVAAEDGDAALEASLIAADLVICQTGCVGHNAYWRVQDHCRRTGKPCVLVDQPQVIHFMRGAQVPRAEPVAHTAA